jgi:hypothetical protein
VAEVDVSVDEPWHHGHALELDNVCRWSLEIVEVVVQAPDRQDATAADGHGAGARQPSVLRVHGRAAHQ